MGLTIWKLTKMFVVMAVLVGSAYYSLRTRVETEIGPWEQWVGKDPTRSEANTQKPKNLQGRFWTGVPRGGKSDLGRIDRHGYSLGYSPSAREADWAAAFLPGGKVSSNSGLAKGIWNNDPEINPGTKERAAGGGQLVPEWLMSSFYGYGDDTWYRSNRVERGEKTMEDWGSHLQAISDYAAVYGGVVTFIGPYQRGAERGFFSVVLRRGERGPEVLAFILPEKAGGGLGGGTVPVEKVEEVTGLRFFADLPAEWRNYLRKKRAGAPWPR